MARLKKYSESNKLQLIVFIEFKIVSEKNKVLFLLLFEVTVNTYYITHNAQHN